MNKAKERNLNIDLLKLICSFFVVLIHIPNDNEFITSLMVVTRSAVPIFFMISGFFYKEENIEIQIKKIWKMALVTSLIYLMWGIFLNIGNIFEYLKNAFSIKNIFILLIFNENYVGIHLWYLFAYLNVLIIIYLLKKCCINLKKINFIIPILLILELILGKYSLLFFRREFEVYLVRNYIFVGLPYFLLGTLLKENRICINKHWNIFIIITFWLTSFLERELLINLNLNTQREHYISTTFLALAIFLFFKNLNVNSRFEWLYIIGNKCSTSIYLMHPIILDIYKALIKRMNVKINCIFSAFIVFAVTIMTIKFLDFLRELFFRRKEKCREEVN